MNLEQVLNIAACIVLIIFGVYAIVQPRAAAQLAHLTSDNPTALAETRITFGGPSLAMGAAGIILNQQAGYQVLGLVWLIVLAVRLVATWLDRPPLERTYVVSAVFELVTGLILLL